MATIEKNERVILFNEQFGYVRGLLDEEFNEFGSGSALLRVTVNSASMPGVNAMTINTNHWKVYAEADPRVLMEIMNKFVPKAVVR